MSQYLKPGCQSGTWVFAISHYLSSQSVLNSCVWHGAHVQAVACFALLPYSLVAQVMISPMPGLTA